MRRDAVLNRERVLAAAATVFADQGIEASVEEIARTAGVGMGTLYRRFPTKEALIAELVRDMLERMQEMAEAASAQPDGRGLEHYLAASSAYQAEHRGCLPRLWSIDEHRPAVQRLRRSVTAMLNDAKRHGRVRAELTATDITAMMWAIRGVIETTGDVAPDAWRRQLEILVAGLRPDATSLTHPPLTRQQVDATMIGT